MDADTKEVLAAKNENEKLSIASTTKLMTAVAAVESFPLFDEIRVDRRAVGVEGSSVYLFEGEKTTLNDLLFCLLLESANDAAEAIAYAVSGSVEDFAALMNETAKRIGMKNTHFANPHGLYDKEHYSTAYDMALLTAYAGENEIVAGIMATKSLRLAVTGKNGDTGEYRYLSNHNKLLRMYDLCIGGKTGFTVASGRCLASLSEKGGPCKKRLAVMTIDDPDDWNDHIKLSDYGFSLYSEKELLTPLAFTRGVDVTGGEETFVEVTNPEGLCAMVKESDEIIRTVELPFFLYAPVFGLDVISDESYAVYASHYVGKVTFSVNGAVIGEVNLFPKKSVAKRREKSFWEKIIGSFQKQKQQGS